jgi:acetoin utilization deacetylase AcuC-like enzyme
MYASGGVREGLAMMFVTYHPDYVVDIGVGHRFPMQKYGLVYAQLLAEGTLRPERVVQPAPATLTDLLLVHTRDYVERFVQGVFMIWPWPFASYNAIMI